MVQQIIQRMRTDGGLLLPQKKWVVTKVPTTLGMIGLILFVVMVIIVVSLLLLDLHFLLSGRETISEYCWDHPFMGVVIIFGIMIGVVGLIVHFKSWKEVNS